MRYTLIAVLAGGMLHGCSASEDKPLSLSENPMRTEFLEHCQARPEYNSRKRAGTLDKYCRCIFDKTMKMLTEKERIAAGFYLYGETSEGYMDRYQVDIQDAVDGMMPASQAIGEAVKSCR